ncbi:MAG: translation initiation factor IF-3 [Myxococcota bacterium]
MRVIGPDGEMLGIMSPNEARNLAEQYGLDLVEVSPNSRPPVCRILDYGKFKYEQKKKQAEQKKKQTVAAIKEVKFRVKIEAHDFGVKVKHIKKFLAAGNKCKVTVMFRGREITHPELAVELLEKVIKEVGELGVIDKKPSIEGRNMTMLFFPDMKAVAKLQKEGGAGNKEPGAEVRVEAEEETDYNDVKEEAEG